jgi:FkbM family methyltransferase
VSKIKIYRKYLNKGNLNSMNLDYDYIVTPLDKNIFLFNVVEFDLNIKSSLFRNKFFPDYYAYSEDALNKFLISNFVKQGDLVVDIGCHVGIYSAFLSELVGNKGRVFCFEPHKEIVQKLSNNLILNGFNNYEIHNYGLGDADKDMYFNAVSSEDFIQGTVNSSFFENEKIGSKSFKGKFEKIKTKVRRLDSVLINEEIKFVKIDVEGFEVNVLKGMTGLIKRCRPIIIFEFHTPRLEYLNIEFSTFNELIAIYYNVFKISVDVKTRNIAFKEFHFESGDGYIGDLICLPKESKIIM